MFPARFTDRARLVINYAHEEADRLNRNQVDTEHLLLGLLRKRQSFAMDAFQKLGVSLDRLEMVVRKRVKKSPTDDGRKQLFFTRAANQALQYAMEEARRQKYGHVGTEHILLGLIRAKNGIAAEVLSSFNVTLEKARRAISSLPYPPGSYSVQVPTASVKDSWVRVPRSVRDPIDIEIFSESGLQKSGTDPYVARLFPIQFVQRLKMIPLKIEDNILYVAATKPLNLPGIDELKLLTGLKVEPVIVSVQELRQAINGHFSAGQKSKQCIIDMTFQEMEILSRRGNQVTMPELEEAPVVELVNSIIHIAVNDNANEIRLEPQYPEMCVRYRLDGGLRDITCIPRHIESAVVARIKLLAGMDISERQRPQHGYIGLTSKGQHIGLNVSTIFTTDGEGVMIEILYE